MEFMMGEDESTAKTSEQRSGAPLEEWGLQFLSTREVRMIDELLASVGEYGEVKLSIKNGRLRFIERIESIDALKYEGENSP
jgi:hypothetical protein